jgi:crossover junction endodeoxyribonuclease RusA
MRVTLPYPDSRLSPNARLHWAQKSKLVKSARQAAFVLSRHAGVTPAETVGQIDVSITMYAPDRRARDFDNAIASLKASLDGLADALRVDDNRFRLSFAWGEPCKPGRVEIVIGEKA